MRLDYVTGLGRTIRDMPFKIRENANYGHPLGSYFSDNVRSLHHPPDRGDMVSVEAASHSRIRAAHDETQRIVQEESYPQMNERMRNYKQGQLVDIWV